MQEVFKVAILGLGVVALVLLPILGGKAGRIVSSRVREAADEDRNLVEAREVLRFGVVGLAIVCLIGVLLLVEGRFPAIGMGMILLSAVAAMVLGLRYERARRQ